MRQCRLSAVRNMRSRATSSATTRTADETGLTARSWSAEYHLGAHFGPLSFSSRRTVMTKTTSKLSTPKVTQRHSQIAVVFGLGEDGPRAARFPDGDQRLIAKIAIELGLRQAIATKPSHFDIA